MSGRLITLEGIDGVGKTTHAKAIVGFLQDLGLEVKHYREPGGTLLGEQLRMIIKDGHATSPTAELMLFAAARAELVHQHVKPDLERGCYVVIDRFTDSTLAYQGALEEISDGVLVSVCLAAATGLYPDLTFWLDIDPELAASRRFPLLHDGPAADIQRRENGGQADAIEQRNLEYFTNVRHRYMAIHESDRQRVTRIDASGSIEETSVEILSVLEERMASWSNLRGGVDG